jgi:hypothetical protein
MSRVNIASLNINIVASSTGLQSQVNQAVNAIKALNTGVQQQNQGLAKSFSDIDKIILRSVAIYGIFRAANFGKEQLFDSVKLAADAETAAISFEVLLKSAKDSAEIIEGLYKFVDETPFFSLEESRGAAKQLAAFGFETKKILPTLRALADVSAAVGQPLSEIANIYGKAKVQQRLYTRDLTEFTGRGIPVLEALAKQFAPLGEDVEEFQAKVTKLAVEGKISFDDIEKAFASMTAEGGDFDGFLDRLSATAAGRFSELQDKLNRLKTEFGTGLIPALNDAVIAITELITQGDEGASTMDGFNAAGKLLGESLIFVAAQVQLLRAAFVNLEEAVAYAVAGVGFFVDAVAGTQVKDFAIGTAKILGKQGGDLERSANRLLEMNARIKGSTGSLSRTTAESLGDIIGSVPDEIQRARNQFKFLKEDAEKFAEALKKNLLTPLERFEQEVRLLVQANILGFLDETAFGRALSSEVEKLNSATQRLKATLNDGSSFERNSVAAEGLIARTRSGASGGGANNAAQIVAAIREQVAAEIALMEKQTESQDNLTVAVDSLRVEIEKQTVAPSGSGSSRTMYPSNPRDEVGIREVAEDVVKQFRAWANGILGGARGAVREINVRNSPLRQPTGSRPGVNDSASVTTAINTNSALDRAKLDRIATAVEKFANQPPIQVQTFVA